MDGDTSNKALERGASAYVKHYSSITSPRVHPNTSYSAMKDTEFTNGIHEDAKADISGRVSSPLPLNHNITVCS